MKTILVPTDFSTCANNAVKYAIQFAKQTGSEILFFHSVNSIIDEETFRKYQPKEYAKYKLKEEITIRKKIGTIYKNLHIKLNPKKVNYRIIFDSTLLNDISNIASKEKIDLIIIGTHGSSGIKKALFGSNTSHIISKIKTPVLAIPLRHRYFPIKEIVYASDLENVKEELKLLKSISKNLKVKITSVFFDYGWAKSKKEMNNLKVIKASNTSYHSQNISLETPLIEPLKNYMKKRTNAILCMFHHSKNGITKLLLGSNTEGLSMDLKMPLLSIQKNIAK